jgi:hypothetical protein
LSSKAVDFESCQALQDVRALACEYGTKIKINIRNEIDIKRDKYNSIAQRDTGLELSVHAYPLNYSPSTYDLQKAGLKENSKAIAWVPMQDFKDAKVEFNDIEIHRTSIQTPIGRYEITDKVLSSQFGSTYLYIVFGLAKL